MWIYVSNNKRNTEPVNICLEKIIALTVYNNQVQNKKKKTQFQMPLYLQFGKLPSNILYHLKLTMTSFYYTKSFFYLIITFVTILQQYAQSCLVSIWIWKNIYLKLVTHTPAITISILLYSYFIHGNEKITIFVLLASSCLC